MPSIETVFLDRDGIINVAPPDCEYISNWDQFSFLPRVVQAIRLLTQAEMRIFIVTNQRGIARGLVLEEDLLTIHQRMLDVLSRGGGRIDGIYYCPHERGECSCRKPDVGLFLRARAACPGVDFGKAVVVGDSLSDMEAGHRLGCRNILVRNPNRATEEALRIALMRGIRIHGLAESLFDAVSRFVLC